MQADRDCSLVNASGVRSEPSQLPRKKEFSVTVKLTQTSFVSEKAHGSQYAHSWSPHGPPLPLWTVILRTTEERWVLWITEPQTHLLPFNTDPSSAAFPLPYSPSTQMSRCFRIMCDTMKAAFHDISVTNSSSDELDSISYLQLLTHSAWASLQGTCMRHREG